MNPPIETSLIKLLLGYAEWEAAVNNGLSIQEFPKELQPLFSVVDNFHSTQNDEKANLSINDLANLLFAATTKDHSYYKELLPVLDKLDVSDKTSKVLLATLVRNRHLKELSLAAYDVTEGRTSPEKFQSLLDGFKALGEDPAEDEEEDFLVNDLESIVNKVIKTPGLKWRLKTMNRMLGSLRKGNFGFIFARPETGKTTFLASEVTFMAEQLAPDAGPILWLNNEQQGEEVLLRLYQASLGCDTVTLLSDIPRAQAQYLKKTQDKLKLVDRGDLHKKYVESLCKKYKPSLIVIDQMDAVRGFDADRKDLQLGEIYRWGRELAKQYCPVIAVCQADGTGENVKWLTMTNVADAKTAKQAHPDFILGIGKQNAEGYDNIRYLHLSKNKLHGDAGITEPSLKHGRMEVLIEQYIGRYKDLL